MFDNTKKQLTASLRKISMQRIPYYKGTNFDNCGHVMLYPSVKCAYNRIKKSANSSTLMFMGDALTANGYSQRTATDQENYHNYKRKSIEHGVSLSKTWRPSDLKAFQNYFWFTVVRNPYTRLLSAYLQKGQEKERQLPQFIEYPGFDRLDPNGFRNFLTFLEKDGLYKNKHWWPQSDLLFMPADRFDFIAKTESLERDLGHVFQQIGLNNTQNLSISKPHSAEVSANWKVTNANSRYSEFYDKKTCAIVYELYKADFINFGYDYDEFQ